MATVPEWLGTDPPREQVLQQIQADYELTRQTLNFCELQLEFIRVTDPESILDDLMITRKHDQLEWTPYWAQAWDASFAVADVLAERELAGMHVLDLGCGMGVTGAVAAARGAQVTMADHAPPALLFAFVNSWPWRSQIQFRRVDWRTDQLPDQFDLIVGAEILYDREDMPYLDQFWRRHLHSQGTVLLGDPYRPLTRDLLDRIKARGWQMRQFERKHPQTGHRARLIELHLPSDAPQPSDRKGH